MEVRKQKCQNRKMTEDLPVLETEVIEPAGVDLSLYHRIGEETTRVVKHKPGMFYIKEIIRPKYAFKDSTQLPPAEQKGVDGNGRHQVQSQLPDRKSQPADNSGTEELSLLRQP